MAKVYVLNCSDVGVDCEFSTRGSRIEDVIERCADHARENHGMKSFTPALYAKMRACLHEVEEEPVN